MQVTVWGSGAWGMALAGRALRAGHAVRVYSRGRAAALTSRAATGAGASAVVDRTDDLAFAAASDNWIVAMPTPFLPALTRVLQPHVRSGIRILSCVKGLAAGSGDRPTQVLAHVLAPVDGVTVHVLGGPNLAHEVAQGLPAAAVLAGPQREAPDWRQILGADALALTYTTDVPGVEYGGALKNVVAIVAACTRRLYGENAAAYVAHAGFEEMRLLASHAGARQDTLLGLSGLGDLLVTAVSETSRNHRFGDAIARGVPPAVWLAEQASVVEGVGTAHGADILARRFGISLPVLRAALLLVQGADPRASVGVLLGRSGAEEAAAAAQTASLGS